jgi:exopolyphosphatase/pppGpp-phosphohydrolase
MPTPTTDTTAVLQEHYALARQQQGMGSCIVVLHLGAQACGIAVGTGSAADRVQLLPLGLERTAAEQFKTTPPTPMALENAIMVVEDVVMPLRALIARDAQLFCADGVVREIAQIEGVPMQAPMVLSLDAMERSFERLSRVVQGMPAAHEGLPANNRFATALLILREFMHHLQFSHVTVLENSAA